MKQDSKIYQLKITLLESDPPIWRRFLVPSSFRLDQLHTIVQIVMGWQDAHLHEFRIGGRTFGRPDWEDSHAGARIPDDERNVRLDDTFTKIGANAMYIYDFGDDWRHEVLLEGILPAQAGQAYPVCLRAEFLCPPEDCGGMRCYDELLRILDYRYDSEYKEMRRWVGKDFDPDVSPVDKVNQELARLDKHGYREP
jgi:hypothetical protein